jgi:hypothetical protein
MISLAHPFFFSTQAAPRWFQQKPGAGAFIAGSMSEEWIDLH